jgi:hypothetical protein
MPSWKRKLLDKIKHRNPYAVPARQRKSGVIDPRNKPRGGAKNWRDFLDDFDTDSDLK